MRLLHSLLILPSLILIIATATNAQTPSDIRGTVVDITDAPIDGAQVELTSASGTRLTVTDSEGHFVLSNVSGAGALIVRYPGFAPFSLAVDVQQTTQPLRIALTPAPNVQRIQVSAESEDRIQPTPASQYSIPRQELEVSGSLSVDEILRQVPGFTLFRRAGSLFANPTTQGVSLRGVGANGTSRAVVLVDGIPLNDPFGGWIYWNRVPRVSIENMEIINGAASDVYGGGALGGVVNIQTRPVRRSFVSIEASYGNENTGYVALEAGAVAGPWAFSASGQALRTDGYIIVPPNLRGAIDVPAGTGDLAGVVEIVRDFKDHRKVFARFNALGESRQNGTPKTANDTTIPEIDLGADWSFQRAGSLSLRVYGTRETFHQGFSSPGPGRNSEAQSDLQRSPSAQLGVATQWGQVFAGKHAISAGIEAHGVHGHSFERFFCTTLSAPCTSIGQPSSFSDSGGRQTIFGLFAQDAFHFAAHWVLSAGGRVDTWSNASGFSYSVPLISGTPTSTTFPNRRETAFSPRLSLLRTFGSTVAVSASVYQGFRAPNLNELYRSFRVGAALTSANAALLAERLIGGETGISFTPWAGQLTLRGNFFWSDISDPVTNVPISANLNQRQNLGAIRARGTEITGEVHLPEHMQFTAGYLLSESTVISAPGNPALVGLWLPEVPRNEFNFQWSYATRNWTVGVQGRFAGLQYDDLSTRFPMDGYFSLDAQISRQISQRRGIQPSYGTFQLLRNPFCDMNGAKLSSQKHTEDGSQAGRNF